MLEYPELFRHQSEVLKFAAPSVSLRYKVLADVLDAVPSCYHGDMIRAVLGIPEPSEETEAADA
jgi:hypothetical protein